LSKKVALLNDAFGRGDLSRDESDIVLTCPSCKKTGKLKKKLSVRLDDGVYHCWVCGLKGHNIEVLFRKFSPRHLDAVREIKFGRHEVNHRHEEDVTEGHPEVQMPSGFVLLGASLKSSDPDIKDTIRYCYDRGLTDHDLWYFKLGTFKDGSLRRRVVFPSFDSEGHLNYFTARSIDGSDRMKYINAKVSKKSVIFNEINIDWRRELTLVEGPFDLTKSNGNTACLLGSHLSKDSELFKKIARHGTPILLALDPDARRKSHDIAKLLSSYGVAIRTVDVPVGRDVGDMSKSEFKGLIKSAAEWDRRDRLLHMISNIKTGSII